MRPVPTRSSVALLLLALATSVPAEEDARIQDLHRRGYEAEKALDHEAALGLYSEAYQLLGERKDDLRARLAAALGRVLFDRGELENAEQYLYEASVLRADLHGSTAPEYLLSLNSLAYLYAKSDRAEQALPSIEHVIRTIRADPDSFHDETHRTYLDTYAVTLEQLDRIEEASAAFEECLALGVDPEDAPPSQIRRNAEAYSNYAAFLRRHGGDAARIAELDAEAERLEAVAVEKAARQ